MHCGVVHNSKHKSKVEGGGLILLGVYQCIAMHARGIFEKELKSVFGILGFKANMKSDLP